MLSQTYLIYLGIAVVIIIIAFFAYQELQKHKMEIQKLRFQSEKLQKIIHAYNMQQWSQQTEYPDESDEDESDEESNENEDEEELSENEEEITGDDARQVVNDILKEALSASGGGANVVNQGAEKVSNRGVGGEQTVVMAARTTRISRPPAHQQKAIQSKGGVQIGPSIFMTAKSVQSQLPRDSLPNIDTFEVNEEDIVPEDSRDIAHPVEHREVRHVMPQQSVRQVGPSVEESPEVPEEDLPEVPEEEVETAEVEPSVVEETINVFENENDKTEDLEESVENKTEVSTLCPAILKSGDNKGNPCGKKAKLNGFCLTHFRKQNTQTTQQTAQTSV